MTEAAAAHLTRAVHGNLRARKLGFALGVVGAASSAFAFGLTIALGLYSQHVLFYVTFMAAGVLGALIVFREPGNSVGWLMSIGSLAAIVLYLPIDYGYATLVIERSSWPLAGAAVWFGTWAWAPVIGLFFPMLTVRFPDGRVARPWRVVDWLAAAGTVAYAGGVALAPWDVLIANPDLSPSLGNLHLSAEQFALVGSSTLNPLGIFLPAAFVPPIIDLGLGLILLAYGASVVSFIDRYRRARGDERLQLKWFACAGLLVAVAFAYGIAALIAGWPVRADVGAVFHLTFLALPVAIGVAILHYRLYDIDLIINRTLVYGTLTAILAASYAAGVVLLQRLFVSVSGQKSDAAYVLIAFGIVVGFSPLKDWLQGQVNSHVTHLSPSAVLDQFCAGLETVVSVIDVNRAAFRLLDEAVVAFGARGGALYLRGSNGSGPAYSRGTIHGGAGIEVPLRFDTGELGRLVLGSRRGDIGYTERDRVALQRSADLVAEALALGARLGFRSSRRSRGEPRHSSHTSALTSQLAPQERTREFDQHLPCGGDGGGDHRDVRQQGRRELPS